MPGLLVDRNLKTNLYSLTALSILHISSFTVTSVPKPHGHAHIFDSARSDILCVSVSMSVCYSVVCQKVDLTSNPHFLKLLNLYSDSRSPKLLVNMELLFVTWWTYILYFRLVWLRIFAVLFWFQFRFRWFRLTSILWLLMWYKIFVVRSISTMYEPRIIFSEHTIWRRHGTKIILRWLYGD